MPRKIHRLMFLKSYDCIIGTFLQGLDFCVRFSNHDRPGSGQGKLGLRCDSPGLADTGEM
jgi:hypothetical protein